jgi:hypothetical protein
MPTAFPQELNTNLVLFALYMPLIGTAIRLICSLWIGLNVGTGMLFIVLCASSLYIAVPAAIRLALPQAKAAINISMSLAITLPFNILFGLSIYFALAEHFVV